MARVLFNSVRWRKILKAVGGSDLLARRYEYGVFGDGGLFAVDDGPEEDGVDAVAVLV